MSRPRSSLALVAACAVLLGVACSVQDGPIGEASPIITTPPTTVGSTTVAPTTTIAPSSAVIEIGPAVYELDAVCASGGASEIRVAVSGDDVNGRRVVGLVHAFEAEPYVGLRVGEGEAAVLFESRFDRGLLEFELVDDVLVFDDVDFVSGLDLETGEFVPAGLGSVSVECRGFVRELPEEPFG